MEKERLEKGGRKNRFQRRSLEELYALSQTHEITFHKVAGHADNELNNRCDELARKAITELRKNLPEDYFLEKEETAEE